MSVKFQVSPPPCTLHAFDRISSLCTYTGCSSNLAATDTTNTTTTTTAAAAATATMALLQTSGCSFLMLLAAIAALSCCCSPFCPSCCWCTSASSFPLPHVSSLVHLSCLSSSPLHSCLFSSPSYPPKKTFNMRGGGKKGGEGHVIFLHSGLKHRYTYIYMYICCSVKNWSKTCL